MIVKKTKNQFYIEMFGQFCISGGGKRLDEDSIRSDMLVKLIAYIYNHRKKEITIQELIDALWEDDESANPAGALKNLVYRVRTLFKKEWPKHEFILTGHGSYKWNDEIPCISDAEILDSNFRKAGTEHDPAKKVAYYLAAIEAYEGPFLPKISDEHWIAPWNAYYHSTYLTAVKAAAEILEKQEQFEEMERICNYALSMDRLSEELYCGVIKALIKQNKMKLAEQQYKKAVDVLYENLGVTPSAELKGLYNEFLKITNAQELNLSVIQRSIAKEVERGAFLCDYGLFQKTYLLEKCRAERLGISIYLMLVTVEPLWNVKPDSQAYMNIINDAMDKIEYVMLNYLRSGDVVSRYSTTQYIALLPTCQYETAKKVVKRMKDEFEKRYRRSKARLNFSIEELKCTPTSRHERKEEKG